METAASFEARSAPSPYPTTLTKSWMPHGVRDQVVDFVRRWSGKTEIRVGRFPAWLGVTASKSMTGGSATGVSMSTTVGFPGISGWRHGRRKPSSPSTRKIRWKGIGG